MNTVALATFTRPDVVFAGAYVLLFPYVVVTKRTYFLPHVAIALLIGLVWTFLGSDLYGYAGTYLSVGSLSLYPLATWSAGLFFVWLLSSHLWTGTSSAIRKLTTFSLLYWLVLIGYETFAYHVLGIRNPTTSEYPGLPGCDCIHAPRWMQLVYLGLGPAYCLVCLLIDLGRSRHSRMSTRG